MKSLAMRCCNYIVIILFLMPAISSNAETYQRGTVILLPSRMPNAPGVFPLNNNNGTTVIQRGKITQQSPVSTPLTANPRQQNNSNRNDEKMTDTYAAHMFTGVCAQDYRERIAPINEPNLNNQKLWGDIQASCKCLSEEIIAVVPASDLADYVMYNYGAETPQSKNLEKITYLQSGQADKVSALVANAALTKKCGFLK